MKYENNLKIDTRGMNSWTEIKTFRSNFLSPRNEIKRMSFPIAKSPKCQVQFNRRMFWRKQIGQVFHAVIDRNSVSPARGTGNACTLTRAGFAGNMYTLEQHDGARLPLPKAGFSGPWRRQRLHVDEESALLATCTRRLLKRSAVQHGSARLPCRYRRKFGFTGDTWTLDNQTTDGTTWRRPSFSTKIGRKPASPARESRQHADENWLHTWRVHIGWWNGWRHNMVCP